MWYFFDESGNWQEAENEKKQLIIAGMFIKSKIVLNDLVQDFTIFKSEHNLKHIHISELSFDIREKLYLLIEKYLKNEGIKILAYRIDPKIIISKTQVSEDYVYIDYASDLIVDMILMDESPIIEYDMKFHYSYAPRVLEELKKNKYDEFTKMRNKYLLKRDRQDNEKSRILKQFNKYRRVIENYDEYVRKLNDIRFLNNYLWEEFRLKVEKSLVIKEMFKDRINEKIKNLCKNFGIGEYNYKLNISYKNKFDNSVGVEFVDIINNTIYNNIKKDIISYIEIKDFKWNQ